MTPPLTLYYKPTCPYCVKVLDFLKNEKITVPLKDTSANLRYRNELLKIGGQTQVPCLVIGRQALYESDDIIEWFKEHRLSP